MTRKRARIKSKPQGTIKPTRSKSTKKSTPPKKAKNLTQFTLTNDQRTDKIIPSGVAFKAKAMKWKYLVGIQERWKRDPAKMIEQARNEWIIVSRCPDLESFLTNSKLVEVNIPFTSESEDWEGRLAPWEYVLSTVGYRKGRVEPLIIIRHLDIEPSPRLSNVSAKPKVLYVESAPGILEEEYEFGAERKIFKSIFDHTEFIKNPTKAELASKIKEYQPEIIHLTGIDNHEAYEILKELDKVPATWSSKDGMVLADSRGEPNPVDAEELADILNCGRVKPAMVTTNLYHSASRICALTVAKGTRHSIGFLDTIGDAAGEFLFREFYSLLAGKKGQNSATVLDSFISTLNILLGSSSKVKGSGIVLWSAESLIKKHSQDKLKTFNTERDKLKNKPLKLQPGVVELEFDIKPRKRLNYSLLHNYSIIENHESGGGLFEKFRINKNCLGIVKQVTIQVNLFLGTENHPFKTSIDITDEPNPLEGKIQIPLISKLIRSVSEPLRTTMAVEISWDNKIIKHETYPVTLLPTDEWTDTEEDRVWLPSFIFPRDSFVTRILSRAQKHLATLEDDLTAAFDGYQRVYPEDPDTLEYADTQVRAIWAAIVNDFGIKYINPPPTYTEFGQRLRTPSQIEAEGKGTCIDLALLLAACLEYIDIYPVIFLTRGHAFAGYWKSSEYHYKYMSGAEGDGIENEKIHEEKDTRNDWHVEMEHLIPLETTVITDTGKFSEALDQGKLNFFNSKKSPIIIDIKSERKKSITPLPIIEEAKIV